MKTLTTALFLSAGVFLSACSQSPFARGGVSNDSFDTGISTSSPSPNSPAYFSQTIGDTVLFEVDQSTLTAQARTTLASQAQWMTTNTTYAAIVEGHADEQGTREYNLALGARRAAAARDYLVSQGVSDTRLRTVTFGKERPLEVCSTEVCYAKNRRSVTVISAGLGS